MNLKKIFVVAVLLLSVFLIYLTTMDKKIYYLALGDSIALGDQKISYPKLIQQYFKEKDLLEEYRFEFIEDDLRITDLIRNIEDNKKVMIDGKEKTIKNALIKADLVTLSIGNEELFYKMKTEKPDRLYHYIDEMMEDMEKLFQLMKEYCKEDIFVIGYINPFQKSMDSYIKYANQKLKILSTKYKLSYIMVETLKEKSLFQEFGLSSLGQQKLAELLYREIEKKVIQDQ